MSDSQRGSYTRQCIDDDQDLSSGSPLTDVPSEYHYHRVSL